MAFANDKPQRSITWPPGAKSGDTRIVVGADTPSELAFLDADPAILFYAVDEATDLEMGYFFIAVSNTYDLDNQKALLFGSTMYPTPGDPSSATSAEVYVHDQRNLGHPGAKFTVFKNVRVQFLDTCLSVRIDPTAFFGGQAVFEDVSFFDAQVQFNGATTDVHFQNRNIFISANREFVGWPIGAERIFVKPTSQGTALQEPTEQYDDFLYAGALDAGTYEFEYDLLVSGVVAFTAGGTIQKLCHRVEATGTVTAFGRTVTGPPDTTSNYGFPGNIGQRNGSTTSMAAMFRHGVNTAATWIKMRGMITWSSDNNDLYLKFCKNNDAGSPAGNVTIVATSTLKLKRWA